MQAKFCQLIEADVRQIAILADDAGPVGGATTYVKLLNDITVWLRNSKKHIQI
ncbi:MAG: hypothetical protein V8R63_05965 [Thomasclavelia ramosa]